jgi:hypothetical protein
MPQLLGDLFVAVEDQYPRLCAVIQSHLLLGTVAKPLLMNHPCSSLFGDGHGPIGGTAVDDNDLTHESARALEAFAEA